VLSELTEITRVRFSYRAICTLSWKGSNARGAHTLFHCACALLTDAKLAYISFCIHSLGNIVYLLSLVGLVKACWCGCFCVALWITREYVVALFARICVTIFPIIRPSPIIEENLPSEGFVFGKFYNRRLYTPISIKVASVMDDAWSLFHSPQSIMFAIIKCIDQFSRWSTPGENQILKEYTFALVLRL